MYSRLSSKAKVTVGREKIRIYGRNLKADEDPRDQESILEDTLASSKVAICE